MTLKSLIKAQISATGPLTVAEYMQLCLQHPEHGYYTARDPLGAAGDFTTAPEISQMFGELLGLCIAQHWLDAGAPQRFTLAELGPGRGTLMADLMRATGSIPGFHQAAQIQLIETSGPLKAKQAEALTPYAPEWHPQLKLTDQPLYLIANEFFDALPIRQFVRDANAWRERVIGLTDGQLSFGLTDPAPIGALNHRLEDTKDGDLIETCAPAQALAQIIGQQIAEHDGAALIIDYGDWRSQGDTLQALANHQHTHPLARPGAADLTAHVDFEALTETGAQHSKLTPQGIFLERLGITQRAQTLAANLGGDALQSHIAAHRRLTHPAEMGTLFKALALFKDTPPPGFST